MPERSVVTRYEAKVDQYLAGVAKMQAATTGFAGKAGTTVAKHKADWDRLGRAALIGGAAIGLGVVGAAKAYMDFEAAMSKVGAAAGATAAQQKALGEAAIRAGQDTVFSATEAAEAEAELVKAGVSVADVMGGALRGSLDLAAAGQIDLAKSAEISAQAMNIFNLEGKDVGHIADVLTAGANKSAAGVDDLGLALQQGGLVAKQTGLTLEDTVGTLSAFADNALKGSDAGTSLKTMLQRLNPQSDEAAALMDQLGLRAYDAGGNFVGVAAYAGKLQRALGDMSAEQRNAALSTLFGSDAVRGANVLYEQGEAGIRQYIAAVDDQGAAARMAARQTDNLKGDIEQLRGTLESAFIRGGAGGNEGLRSLVQTITEAVDWFNKLSPATQSSIVQIAAVTAGALLLAGAGIKAATSVAAMKASMDAASLSGTRLATVLRTIGSVAAVAGVAALAHELGQVGPAAHVAEVGVDRLAESVGQLAGKGRLTGGIADLFREDNGIFGSDEKWVSAAEAIDRFAITANNALGDDLTFKIRRVQDFGASGQKMADTVKSIDGALAQMVRSGNADQAKAAFDNLLAGISDPKVREQARAMFEQYQASLDEATVSADATAAATSGLAEETYDAARAAQDAADGTKAFADELAAINQPALDVRDAARQVEQAYDDATAALKKNGKNLDINTQKGRDNQAALDDVAGSLNDQIGAMQANGASQGALQRKLDTSRDRLYKVARQFGMTDKEARTYIDSVLAIPASKTTTVTAKTEEAKRKVQALQSQINRLRGNDVTITTRYVTVGTRPGGGRSTAGGTTKDADGGMHVRADGALVKAYADGGFATSLGAMQPQIIPSHAGSGGLLVAEEGAGPWEAFISGNPAKASRSRVIAEDTVDRLGGDVSWRRALADGAVLARTGPAGIYAARTATATDVQPREAAVYRVPLVVDGKKMAEVVFDHAGHLVTGGLTTEGQS